jgi:glycosyltransferase involved in cell wall biosynthesis
MYFDSILLSLAVLRRFPCPLSGIYFRPIFHYRNFAQFTPSRHERLLQRRDKFVLSRLLNHSQLKTLFCLDPFAAEELNQFKSKVKSIYLPDPVQLYSTSNSQIEKLRENLGIQPERKVFLMFGVPQSRKGIYQLLEAITSLSSELCRKLCLLLVGPISSEPQVLKQSTELSDALPIQLIIQDQFVPDQDIQPYFQLADVVLAPYQRHIGMSAILVRAAAAGKPVLSCKYGVMGETVKRYKLGLTVEASQPTEIAQGLTQFLLNPPEQFCEVNGLKSFAEQNSAEKFASIIFPELLV